MSRELRAAMRRHPAGKRLISHKGATILPFRPVQSMSTATAESTISEKGTNNDD
jgi:hypothetical protein